MKSNWIKYLFNDEDEEEEFEFYDETKKSLCKKILNGKMLSSDEYITLLQYALNSYKEMFGLKYNGEHYEMLFREVNKDKIENKEGEENEKI